MKHSGLADSPFFAKQPAAPGIPKQPLRAEPGSDPHETMVPSVTRGHDDTNHVSEPDTVIPRYPDATVETVRLAVKECGKEAATHRFTKSEKEAIAAIVYVVKRQGIRTSENEITRIAVNFILCDYEARGEQSLLAKVLQALNA